VAHVVAVIHVDENPALRTHQAGELTEHSDSSARGKNVAEDIPKTGDDVELGLNRVKFFRAHGPDFGVRKDVALHRPAWLQQHQFRDAVDLRDAAGASTVTRPNVE